MRVHRSFAFVDVCGFTALTESEGDEHAVGLLSTFRLLVRNICSRRGVRIAKWLGDGAMFVGVDTEPLLAAVLEMFFAVGMADDEIVIRCGITAGDVILYEGDDYIGHAVNVAARLCDAAPPGAIVAQRPVLGSLPKWAVAEGTERLAVRGLEQPVEVSRLALRSLEGKVEPDPVCGIPLSREVASVITEEPLGGELWFCSLSCADTWEQRPRPSDELGSLRTPLMGY